MSPVAAQKVVSLAPFSSVETHDGAHVVVQHGPTHRVTLLKGSLDCSSVTVAGGGRLVIRKYKSRCPRGYELEVEVVTPQVAGIAVHDGGWVQTRGSFPRQSEISVAVESGGTIDIRSMAVASVTASVDSGGRILTKPQSSLVASVADGGNITYWGVPRVTKSIQRGGVVERGTAEEGSAKLSEMNTSLSAVPPVAPPPNVQPIRNQRR
jgi:hypothetical protein